MAVMLETSRGDMVIDLFTEDCPKTTKNFLKLCKYWTCEVITAQPFMCHTVLTLSAPFLQGQIL